MLRDFNEDFFISPVVILLWAKGFELCFKNGEILIGLRQNLLTEKKDNYLTKKKIVFEKFSILWKRLISEHV